MLPTVLVLKELLWGIRLRDWLFLDKISRLLSQQCVDWRLGKLEQRPARVWVGGVCAGVHVNIWDHVFPKTVFIGGSNGPKNQLPALLSNHWWICVYFSVRHRNNLGVRLDLCLSQTRNSKSLEQEGEPLWLSNFCRDHFGFGATSTGM